jgi:hypothetical protein
MITRNNKVVPLESIIDIDLEIGTDYEIEKEI